MLFEYAKAKTGQTILIHGAAGNVGAYAVQLARNAGLKIFATAGPSDLEYVRRLGAEQIVNYKTTKFEDVVPPVDVVIDTVGGDTRERSFSVLKRGGILVSVVSPFPETPQHRGVRSVFFIAEVTKARLDTISKLFEGGELISQVGTTVPLEEARMAHEMLAGAPHKRGKIVLRVTDAT